MYRWPTPLGLDESGPVVDGDPADTGSADYAAAKRGGELAAGRQLATLFQIEDLTVRDASCLASSLSLLDRAERARTRFAPGGRKG